MKKEKWEIKKLGEVCEIYQPQTISTSELIENGQYFVFGANGIIGRYDKYNHKKAEILLTCRGATCGTINISKPYSWITGNAMVIRPLTDGMFLQKFLFYLLKNIDYSKIIRGAAQPQITRQSLSPTEIPIPPLPVQEAIVNELDTLHRLKELQEQQLAEYDTLAQATFYSMFGDPIDNEKEWEKIKCENLFNMKLGKMRSAKNYKGTHLKPYLRNVNVQWGELDLTDIKEMDFFDNEFNQYRLKKGDILVCEGGEVGRTAIYNGEIENCCYQNALHRLRIIDENKITREYFLYLMSIGVPQGLIQRLTISVTIKHFALVKFKNMKIPVPPISLQNQFAERIEKIEAQKELVKQSITETQTLIDYTMDKYFG